MAANNVNVRMSVENAEVVRAWLESTRSVQAFSQELDKVAQKGKRAGDATKAAFADAGSQAMQVVSALTGVGSAVGGIVAISMQLKAEYQALVARQKEAADAQVSIYEALNRAVAAHTGANFNVNPDALMKRVVGGAGGVDPRDLLLTLEAGISASGDVSPEDVLQTVMDSVKLAPEMTVERRKALVTGALQLKKGFDNVTPMQALAGVKQSFVAARTEDVTDFAKNMAPGISQMAAFGKGGKEDYSELASIAIAMGQRAGDPTGRRSMNATINMLKQVKEEGLSAGLFDKDASVMQQIEAVRNNPAMQDKLLGVFAEGELGTDWKTKLATMRANKRDRGDMGGDLHGEAKSFIAMVEMLSPGDNKTKQEFESARGKISGLNDEAVDQVQVARRAVAGSQAGQAGELERIRKQADTRALLMTPAGQEQKVMELQDKARQIAGWSVAGRQMAEWDTRLNQWADPTLNPVNLDAAERTAADARERVAGMAPGAQRSEKMENLQGVIDEIKALRADLKSQTLKVKGEKDGAGAAVGAQAAPGFFDHGSPWDLPERGGGG